MTHFDQLEAGEGIGGIRRLFDEVCVATPSLVERLTEHDVYRTVDMEFSRKIFRYFFPRDILVTLWLSKFIKIAVALLIEFKSFKTPSSATPKSG